MFDAQFEGSNERASIHHQMLLCAQAEIVSMIRRVECIAHSSSFSLKEGHVYGRIRFLKS